MANVSKDQESAQCARQGQYLLLVRQFALLVSEARHLEQDLESAISAVLVGLAHLAIKIAQHAWLVDTHRQLALKSAPHAKLVSFQSLQV